MEGVQVAHVNYKTLFLQEKYHKECWSMLVPVSSHDATTIAKSAAAQAFKVAMAAKENAVAKPSAAVKATAARVALEATACAARAGAHAKAELQRKTASSEYKLAESSPKRQLVPPENQKEKMVWRTNVKVEKEEKSAGHFGAASLDDEELAWQQQRVINSSPQISHSLTPVQSKPSVKPETPCSSADVAARGWPQCN
jgi:hypothetical protein